MSVTLVCTVITTVATVTLLSGLRPYGIMTVGLYVSVMRCQSNPEHFNARNFQKAYVLYSMMYKLIGEMRLFSCALEQA
jgi:hypothetical protein